MRNATLRKQLSRLFLVVVAYSLEGCGYYETGTRGFWLGRKIDLDSKLVAEFSSTQPTTREQ